MSVLNTSPLVTYEFTPEQIKQLIGADLGRPVNTLDIQFITSPRSNSSMMDDFGHKLSSVKVTVKSDPAQTVIDYYNK